MPARLYAFGCVASAVAWTVSKVKAKHGTLILDTGPISIERIITRKTEKLAYRITSRQMKYAYPEDLMQIWLALRDEFKQQYKTKEEYRKAYQREYSRRYFQVNKPTIMAKRKSKR